ncbi:hypothetical protein [Rhodococcus sp. NPDC055024]
MASELPVSGETWFLRCVFEEEVSVLDGTVTQAAFEPRSGVSEPPPRVAIESTAFRPKSKDKGLLSTEHGDRPDGAGGFMAECTLTDVAGIWAVDAGECKDLDLPWIDDGGEGELSAWHVSIDFRAYLPEGSMNVNNGGKKKARKLRDRAVARGKQA